MIVEERKVELERVVGVVWVIIIGKRMGVLEERFGE